MKSILFIVDPWSALNVHKDSSLAMMRWATSQGFRVDVALASSLASLAGAAISVTAHALLSAGDINGRAVDVEDVGERRALNDYRLVLMRKDPPFNSSYIIALWLLRCAVQQGARVINDPSAVLLHNEKASILEFAGHTPPTIIASCTAEVEAFLAVHQDIIVKPLNQMGGTGIFRLRKGDVNLHAILESLLQHEPAIMVQTFLPQIAEGDKRVFILGGEVQPFTLARIPKSGETRANLAAGGRGVAMAITNEELKVATALAPIINMRGLTLVGLDMIGGRMTEMNVTSPTCMVEVEVQTGHPIAQNAMKAALKV